MDRYRYWDILDELPEGWVIDKYAGSPAPNTVFITNGKSPLYGQKRALLRIQPKEDVIISTKDEPFPATTVNALARIKFQSHLLNEILFDLTVCELEGWNKFEYIKELRKLLSSINLLKSDNRNKYKQQTLFENII